MRDIMNSQNMNMVGLGPVTGEARMLSVTRKLGYEHFVQHSGWTIDTTKGDCWYHHKHNFTVVLWSVRLGQMASVTEQESQYVREQVSRFQDPVQQNPSILAGFTEWRSQPMLDLVQYVEKNDPSPPDFIGRMIEDGVCNKAVKGNINALDYIERATLQQRQSDYYKKHALRVLRSILPKFDLPIEDELGASVL